MTIFRNLHLKLVYYKYIFVYKYIAKNCSSILFLSFYLPKNDVIRKKNNSDWIFNVMYYIHVLLLFLILIVIGEFLSTAVFSPSTLRYTSFLLNHSRGKQIYMFFTTKSHEKMKNIFNIQETLTKTNRFDVFYIFRAIIGSFFLRFVGALQVKNVFLFFLFS